MAATSDRGKAAVRSGCVREHDGSYSARVPLQPVAGNRDAFRVELAGDFALTRAFLVGGHEAWCQIGVEAGV